MVRTPWKRQYLMTQRAFPAMIWACRAIHPAHQPHALLPAAGGAPCAPPLPPAMTKIGGWRVQLVAMCSSVRCMDPKRLSLSVMKVGTSKIGAENTICVTSTPSSSVNTRKKPPEHQNHQILGTAVCGAPQSQGAGANRRINFTYHQRWQVSCQVMLPCPALHWTQPNVCHCAPFPTCLLD